MISRTTAGVVAGIAGTLIVGYCIYFDRKRRSDPLFKQKLKERRRKAKNTGSSSKAGGGSGKVEFLELPDLQDPEAVQRFFLREVQLGEELLAQGDFDNGVEHLSTAVAVCGQPQQLLQVLHQTLPTPVFQMLVQKLPVTSKRITAMTAGTSRGATIQEVDDIE